MQQPRILPHIALGAALLCVFGSACDRSASDDGSSETTDDAQTDSPKSAGNEATADGDPLAKLAGIYTLASSEEGKKGCSMDDGTTPVERKEGMFYIAPRIDPSPMEKQFGIIGMIASCDDLDDCRKNSLQYLEEGMTSLGSFGGPIVLKDDGTLEQSSTLAEQRDSTNPPKGSCDVWWNRATVALENGQVRFREQHHFAKYPKAEEDPACELTGYLKARDEPCGRVRITMGKRAEDLPKPGSGDSPS